MSETAELVVGQPVTAPPVILPDSAEVTIVLRRPHSKQLLFVESDAKRIVIRAGRRSGKTTGIGIRAVKRFLRGRRVLYATPTADQINKFWSEVKRALAEPIAAGLYKKNETEHYIELEGTNQRIRAKTAWNADTLRGDYADDLILDEFQLMNESAWEEVGAPMLIDNNGDAIFIYTPPSLHSRSTTRARDLRHASKMYKRAEKDATGRWQALHFTSHDNPHVSEQGIEEITRDMTQLAYRQEILAEDIDEVPGALWTRALLDQTRVSDCPPLKRVVIGIDPSGSSTTEAGVVAAGLGHDGHAYVIRDASLLAPTPRAWASAACDLYEELHADRICGERNYGGDMVESTVRTVDPNVSYKDVEATRGKLVRAEPVCAMYEKGMVHHVGTFALLEEEQCTYIPGAKSPNRMDAAIWALTELIKGGGGVLGYWDRLMQEAKDKAAAERTNPSAPADPRIQTQEEKSDMGLGKISTIGSLNKPTVSTKLGAQTTACPQCGNTGLSRYADGAWKCGGCGASGRDDFAGVTLCK